MALERAVAMTPAQNGSNAEERISDEALARSTGYVWDEWVAMLDAHGATDQSRAERADFLKERYGMSLWWANTINVGYERAKAAGAKRERPNDYNISVSKTLPVPVDRLFAAFVEPSDRARWLGNADLRFRMSRPNRSARFDWQGGSSRVTAYFADKGAKSTVRVQQTKLLSAGEAQAMKRFWRERLMQLQHVLDSQAAAP